MLTLLIAISPFALIGLLLIVVFAKDEIDHWWWKRKEPKDKIRYVNGYNPDSPMVKRFQRLANINQPRRYGDYRDRFNLANMTEDVWIPVRE
jgi:hypothetical protein